MRRRQWTVVGLIAFLTICAYTIFRIPPDQRPIAPVPGSAKPPPPQEPQKPPGDDAANSGGGGSPPDRRPKPASGTGSHPMWHLMTSAEKDFQDTLRRQSKTLEDAVKEYRRRYGIPPPPNFDKWFDFAKANGVQLIDEFDMINEMLTPFWGLKPATIRERAREALGFDNNLLGLLIRDHKVSHIQGGQDWQRDATSGMIEKFIQYLPSMDLAFNIHDEPRVVVPHEDLARLVTRAKDVNMPKANAAVNPENAFTKRAGDLSDGKIIVEYKQTRFNEDELADDRSKYGVSELGFVYNITAMSDVCLSPSLRETYGFFDRPNAYNVVHDLFPIFSQSKISSYNDILYPSPWYWYKKVAYDESKDMLWEQKQDRLYWRGSTTGGFSRNGGWRRQHRQHLVQKINAADQAKIYTNRGDDKSPKWEVKEVPRGDYREIIDVYFSHVGQCDPGDCDAQKEFFKVQGHAEQQDAWKYKYLLDMDGNAFSGRFYAFLQSRSLVFKLAIFREWHFEWLRPWAHYVPLSLQGDDWLEAVRFFGDGALGRNEAERMAISSREWANKVLRKEDMEVWFFRLLLEYGRVIDDRRDSIGFSVGANPQPPA
ncbi:capsule-associated protein [Colletotrichum higginsianum]|nr:capsule-associated protein [Colletotrichum higginsianum]